MLDKTTLSQYKYIYYCYSVNDKIHIEQYPIIYINQEYVYYKQPGNNRLSYSYMSNMPLSLEDAFEKYNKNLIYGMTFISKKMYKEDISKEIEEILREKERANFEAEKKKALKDLNYAKQIYEKALAQYKKYEET